MSNSKGYDNSSMLINFISIFTLVQLIQQHGLMHPYCRYIPPRRQSSVEKSYEQNTSIRPRTDPPKTNNAHDKSNVNWCPSVLVVQPILKHPGIPLANGRGENTAIDSETTEHGSFLAFGLVRLFKTIADVVINPFLTYVLGEIETPATIAEYEAEDARLNHNPVSSSTITSKPASPLSPLSPSSSSDFDLRCNTDMDLGEQVRESQTLASNGVQSQTMSLNLRPRGVNQTVQSNPPRERSTQTIDFTEMFVPSASREQENKTSTGMEETPSTADNGQSSIKRSRKKLMKAKSKFKIKRRGTPKRGATYLPSSSTTSEETSEAQIEYSRSENLSTVNAEAAQEEQHSLPVISDCIALPDKVAEAPTKKELETDTSQEVTHSTMLLDKFESPSYPEEALHIHFTRLCNVMEASLKAGQQFVSVEDLRGPLKVCSHLCRGTRNITVVRMLDGMFVLHGVKRLLDERRVCGNAEPTPTHVSVYVIDGVFVNDLKDHYAVVLLAAYVTFESGYCDRLLHYACTRERGTKVDDQVLAIVDQLSARKRLRPNNGFRKDLLKYINTRHCLDQIQDFMVRETNTPNSNYVLANNGGEDSKSWKHTTGGNDHVKEGYGSGNGEGGMMLSCGDEDNNEPKRAVRDSWSPEGSKGVCFDEAETMVSNRRSFDISAEALTSSYMWTAHFRPVTAHGYDEPGSSIESSSEETRSGTAGKRRRSGNDQTENVDATAGMKKVRLEC